MENARFFDNGGKTADRYAILFCLPNDAGGFDRFYYSMNAAPQSAIKGICIYGGEYAEGWEPEGQELRWEDAPAEIALYARGMIEACKI